MASYSNLGIKLITTGDESGTWGSSTNTNFSDVIDEAIAGVVTHNVASDADFTLTITDFVSSEARHAVIKFTSVNLTATRVCTFAPSTLQKTWIVINSTTGGQSLTFKQGSAGATVTVPNGESAIIYSDGEGSTNGAITRVLDSFTNTKITTTTLNATTLDLTNLEVTNIKAKDGTAAISIADSTGKVTVSSELAVDNINISSNAITSTNANGNIDLTPNGTGEVNITKVDIDSGTIDNTSIGATTPSSGAFTTLSSSGTITLSNLTASTALALDASKNVVSVSNTGTGNNVLATSPILVTPNLGTPSSAVLTNATGLPLTTGVTGILPVANGGSGQSTAQAAMNTFAGAVTSGQYLRGDGTNVVMAALSAGDLSGTVAVSNGGTGQTTYTDGQLLIGNSTGNTLTKSTLTAGTGISVTNGSGAITIAATNLGTVTSVDASGGTTGMSFTGGPVTSSGTLTLAGTLDVDNGGTGQTSYTDGQLLIGNSTGNTLAKSTLTAGAGVTITNGSGSITISATGSGGTVTSVDVSGGTTGLTTSGGPVTGTGTITLAGTLALANGGTGQTSAQSAINSLAGAVTSGQYLRGNGTNVVMSAIQAGDVPTLNQNTTGTAGNVTGVVAIANGGTGQTTQQAALNALSGTQTSGYYLRSNGTDVSMSALAAADLSGTVAVANGGTGQTSYTDGQLLIGNSTGNTLSKATITAGAGISVTNGNGSITIAATGGTGDVVGPASATDEALVRFDLTTGKLIQNSNATLTDAGALTLTNGAVINEAGADSDTRIEGDTDANLVFVDASADFVGIGNSSPGSKLDVKGTLRLSGSTSGYVGLAPAAAAGTTTYTLPNADGTNGQILSTNGSGSLSWVSASSGTPGGADTQIQYNSSGAFAGASGLTTDGTNLSILGQGDLRLADADSSNYVAFQAPATVASNVTWTLPNADGTNGFFLSTNGSGTLSWQQGGIGMGKAIAAALIFG